MSAFFNKYDHIKGQLKNDRSSFEAHWTDLADYIHPRGIKFMSSDVNKGDKRNNKIINSSATMALRTLRSGMMSGITSPARPWFSLSTQDSDLMELNHVREWLEDASDRMRSAYLKSNLYNVLPQVYEDMGAFGTACMYVEKDEDNTFRFVHFPIGSYYVANDAKMQCRVFYREFKLTVRQIVEKFATDMKGNIDLSKLSVEVQRYWNKNQRETLIDICHFLLPNDDYVQGNPLSKYKRFKSVYYESSLNGANQQKTEYKLLSESGNDLFRALVPRWSAQYGDVYATNCPGMVALGDIKALQTMEKRKAQAVEKSINPPMKGPSQLKGVRTSILPGDITYIDEREGVKGFEPIHEVTIGTGDIREDIREHELRISRAFYEDLFLMLSQSDRRQITAREIEERHEEKLLALGPVLEQINQDLLDPLIDITFDMMIKSDLIPPPPEELHGSKLKVEYTSIMAQAQKLVGIATIERFTSFVVEAAAADPQVLDKVNSDELIDMYSEMTGVPTKLIRDKDEVAQIRNARNQAAQAQQAAELANQSAMTAKNLSDANLDADNALTRLSQQATAGELLNTGG